VAVRRRPSYGFDLAGTSFGVRPEAGVSRSTLAQLFPELDLKEFAPVTGAGTEQVEKPEDATSTPTPGVGGVTPVGEDTIPGSEFQKYNLSGELSYAAPFNIQVGPTGPQGRGSRLGYSGSAASSPSAPSTSTTTPLSQSASSFAMPKLPEFDYSPFESLLAQGQSILDQIQSASQNMGAVQQQMAPTGEPETEAAPAATAAPTAAASTAPLRLQIKEAAGAAGNSTNLGQTGVKSLISQGADVNKIEQQARAAGVTLGSKAQSTVDRAQVKQIAAAPVSLGTQVQQIAKATESGKITQSAVNALLSSGTSAAKIERAAEKQGVDIGRQAQQLINKAQDNRRNK